MPITKGVLTFDNGRIFREGEDVTDALQETYKTRFENFIERWFGKEALAEFLSIQNEE